MATTAPASLDTKQLRDEVSKMYAQVATEPDGEFHFHRGPAYAVAFLDYDADELADLPAEATASFAGVGNPLAMGELRPGQTVLDVGCGAGMDLLLAAKRVGPSGKAIGVDMTPAMIELASQAARAAKLDNVEIREGDAEALPAENGECDVVISNGVINLTTDKQKAFSEIFRSLKPGGQLLLADIIGKEELAEDVREDIDLWCG